jgi:hypothetical protein
MSVRNQILAQFSPKRYDRLLPIAERKLILDLPEMERGKYKIVHKTFDPGSRFEMLGHGGYVHFGGGVTIRMLLAEGSLGDTMWMSDSPSEIEDMENLAHRAKSGKVLVAGLGMGLLTEILASKPEVHVVDVIEISSDIAEMIAPFLSDKVNVVVADFSEWLNETDGNYDAVILDIWKDLNLDDLNDRFDLWLACKHRFGKTIAGGIWGLDHLVSTLQDECRGYEVPSESAHQLRTLEFDDMADYVEDFYPDANFEIEDLDDPDYDEWSNYEDEAIVEAVYHVYGIDV